MTTPEILLFALAAGYGILCYSCFVFFIFKARLVSVCVCVSFYDIIENCLRLTPRHILVCK